MLISLPTPMQRGFALLVSFTLALGALLPLAAASPMRAAVSELFFSEYIEGSSNNKALEIYNGTGAAIDLGNGGYNVQMFFNGSASAGLTINLTGTVAAGDVFVLAQSSANATILAQADHTNGSGWMNGDDAVVLRKGTTIIDSIGQIGVDPGSEWGSGLQSTADNTLQLKAEIECGDPVSNDAFDPTLRWDGYVTDSAAGLGSHTFIGGTCPVAPPPPTGTAAQIAEIQGAGHTSPLLDELVIDVEGVVTALKPEGSRRNQGGFWIEDPTPDSYPDTSDAIFVYTRTNPVVAVGDLVTVEGTVGENRPFFEDLAITQIASASWTVDSSGNPLPVTTIGVDRLPPAVVIDNDSSATVEETGTYDPAEDGIDFWESLEGMRLAVADAVAVGPTNGFGEIAVVSSLQASAGAWTARGGLLVQNLTATGNYQPGDFNPERLILDDLILGTMPGLNVGDGFAADPVGVLDQSFGAFKLLITEDPGRVDNGLAREVTTAAGAHELAVATFNVENLSAMDSDAKVNQLAAQIVHNLRSPDLIAIEEMQDNSGFTDDGTTVADQSWQRLIDAILVAGGPLYQYRQIDPLDNVDGGAPGGNIRVGFLFHSERGLEFVDRPGGDAVTDTDVVSGSGNRGAQLTVSPGRILNSDLAGEKAFLDTRKSLAGEFRFRGETVFVVANHFSSKGDDRPLFSRYQPPNRLTEYESGDPEDGWRHAQAQAINDFVDEILAVEPDANIIVLGDINDFDFSETVGVLTGELVAMPGGPDPDGSGPTSSGAGPVMSTLFDVLAEAERYSYVFEGNSQVLDQILVSNALMALGPSYDVVHVNAEFAEQASDHDPSVMRVAFQPRDAH